MKFTDEGIFDERGRGVMYADEKPLWEYVLPKFGKRERVLELGLGMGITAKLIDKYMHPRIHDIVECNQKIIKKYGDDKWNIIKEYDYNFEPDTKYDFILLDTFPMWSTPVSKWIPHLNKGGIIYWMGFTLQLQDECDIPIEKLKMFPLEKQGLIFPQYYYQND